MKIETSLYEVALNFLGMKEIPGPKHNPWIQWAFSITKFPEPWTDEDAWCSAALNGWCYPIGVERSGSAAAISWATVGTGIALEDALRGMDIVVFPHHVGLFSALKSKALVDVLGGNQGNEVNVSPFPTSEIVAVRRLARRRTIK
jgi:uncharacterized protein (TIGR02594 family)